MDPEFSLNCIADKKALLELLLGFYVSDWHPFFMLLWLQSLDLSFLNAKSDNCQRGFQCALRAAAPLMCTNENARALADKRVHRKIVNNLRSSVGRLRKFLNLTISPDRSMSPLNYRES